MALPATVINDILNASTEEYPDLFQETLDHYDGSFWGKWAMGSSKPVGGKGAMVQLRVGNQSQLLTHAPFKTDTVSAVTNVLAKWTTPPRWLTYNTSYDELEEDLNGGKEQIVSVIKARESGAIEQKFTDMEGYVLGMPNDENDAETPVGIFYYGRMYTNSSGTPQAQPIPDRNGIYINAWGDASTTNNQYMHDIDLSDARYSRLPNYAASWSGAVDDALRETMRWFRLLLNIETLPGLMGQTAQFGEQDWLFVVPPATSIEMIGSGNNGPDDQMGDAGGRFVRALFQGLTPRVSQMLENDAHNRMVLLNQKRIYPIHSGSQRIKTKLREASNAHTTWTRHTDISYNLHCSCAPSSAIGVLYTV